MRYLRSKFIQFIQFLGERYKIQVMPDRLFLQIIYRHKVGLKLNLNNPQRFTEKIQWLKLYDHNRNYTLMADKYEVKSFVTNILKEDITIPTLGLYNSFDDIPFNMLPQSFVIKCTHDWNSVIICKNKDNFDFTYAKSKIGKALKYNHYYRSLEWAYKYIPPRIIIEPFLSEDGVSPPIDYRVYCFNGNPHFIHLTLNKFGDRKVLFLDKNWDPIPIGRKGLNLYGQMINKPSCLAQMMDAAEKISQGYPFLRIDFYVVKDTLYLGECTFYPAEGLKEFYPMYWNQKFGEMIDTSKINIHK